MKHLIKIHPVLFLLFCACVPWTLVGGKFISSGDGYEVDLPQQWRKQNFTTNLILTKDGLGLQRVVIGRFAIDSDAPHTKRKLSKDMTPQDVAELVIDDLRANQQIANFQVIENVPAQLGGNPGFKLVYSYNTKQNLKKNGVYYGTLNKDWLYFVLYEAPARYYFDRDLQTFETIKESFIIVG
jgi:hypothetical protein